MELEEKIKELLYRGRGNKAGLRWVNLKNELIVNDTNPKTLPMKLQRALDSLHRDGKIERIVEGHKKVFYKLSAGERKHMREKRGIVTVRAIHTVDGMDLVQECDGDASLIERRIGLIDWNEEILTKEEYLERQIQAYRNALPKEEFLERQVLALRERHMILSDLDEEYEAYKKRHEEYKKKQEPGI